MGRMVIGTVLIIAGLNALLSLNLWQYFWPGILIIIGTYILLGRSGDIHHHHFTEGEVVEKGKNHFIYSATFQGIDRKIETDDFRGGKVEAVLGGINLDLREAKIKTKEPVDLRVGATLGGVKIMVPKSWKVENQVSGVAGGVHDTTTQPADKEKAGTLRVFGQVTLGGVEISN